MFRKAVFVLWTVVCLGALPAAAADKADKGEKADKVEKGGKVVLRLPGGRLLRAAEHGTLQAESFIPAARETFELVALPKQQVAVKSPDCRWLVSDGRDGHTPRLESGPAGPGRDATFELVAAGAGRFALRSWISGEVLAFDPPAGPPKAKATAGTLPRRTVEVYRIRELPAILETVLPAAVRAIVGEELSGKEYDKTRKHKIEKYVDLPDPTLKDLKRTKRHQVLGLTEEYRVQAKLDGQPDFQMPAMPLLAGCGEGECGLMLFAVEARLPVQGRVQYQVQGAASASTGYRTTVRLSAVAEVPLERRGKDLTVGSPVVLDLSVSLAHLRLSNDLLEAVHRQVERYVNHELEHNEGRLREQANKALKKALSAHEVRIPLAGYLGLTL
ncbi:MAG: hypothetical protein ABSG86_16310 [Thermoguttaceae bacterium]|jgi:hypothetical protein